MSKQQYGYFKMGLEFEGGFPLHTGEADDAPEGTNSPFSVSTMKKYLVNNHYHYSTDEEQTEFKNFQLREHFVFKSREFWLWSCEDDFGRTWDVVVGQGETPVNGQIGEETWMHATLYSSRNSPRSILLDEYPEHNDELGKAN